MQPLVAVKESQHVSPPSELHSLGSPREADSMPAFASRCKNHRFFKGSKRHRHLQHYSTLLELAQRSQVWPRSVAQWLDDHLVIPRARQPAEDAARIGVREACELGADDHPRGV